VSTLFPIPFYYRKDEGGESMKPILTILKTVTPLLILAIFLAMPLIAFAQGLVPTDLRQTGDIVAVIRAIIRFILLAAFILAFIFLLIGGIRWITAGGDEKGVAGARGMITSALIGLVIVLVAYAIIRLVEVFFGVTIISGTTTPIPGIQPGQDIEQNPIDRL